MFFIGPILLIVLGLLGAANLIIAKKPEAQGLIAKLSPYQGYAGAVGAVWGVVIILHAIFSMGLMKTAFVWWVTYLCMGIVMASLGLLLGVAMLKRWIKDPAAQEKMEKLAVRLAPKQGVIGVIALVLGVWGLIATLIR